ncbi:MAG: SelB C-terminal domain-containing protein, partial [Dehalococcoidia bacterium]|nr:SelB C-terminal domain-containing protein [Dehalococcoidia bacterium]
KKDLVDEEMLELVTMDAEEVIEGTALKGAPIIVTSATTGEGLPDLLAAIDKLLDATTPRRDIGKPRLPIDRVFTMKGFGTVVTGTLIDGKFTTGQEVEILPSGQRTHIRGLQTHKKKADIALPGSRVAVNLAGIATEELQRGLVITTPGWLKPTRSVDARLRTTTDLPQPINHNKTVTFYTGASEVPGRVRLLDQEKLGRGESGWVQILLNEPVAASTGDLFIIRSSEGTLGGGIIVDTQARRHRRFQAGVIESLQNRAKGSPEDILMASVEASEGAEVKILLSKCSLSPEEGKKALEVLVSQNRVLILGSEGPHPLIFSAGGWNRIASEAQKAVQAYHDQFPLRSGMPKEELRSRLKISSQNFGSALCQLASDQLLVEEGTSVRLSSHQVKVTARQQTEIDIFLKSLSEDQFSPSIESLPAADILAMLIDQRRIIKVSDSVFFSASAYDEMVKRVTEHMKSTGKITVAEVRDMFKTSRKYALALMEHLDEQKITRRVGDERVLR